MLAVLAAGCGGGNGAPADAGVADAPPADAATGAIARFALPAPGMPPDFASLPYPSDLYLDTTGHIALGALPVGPAADSTSVSLLRASLATLGGFGVTTATFFGVDGGTVDAASLAAAAREFSLPDCREIPVRAVFRADLGLVVVAPAPGTVLREKSAYGIVLTAAATADGVPLRPSETFRALRDGPRPAPGADADAGAGAGNATALAWEGAHEVIACAGRASPPVAKADVVAAVRFTTQDIRGTLEKIHAQIATAAPPVATLVKALSPADLPTYLGTPTPDTDGMEHAGGDNPGGVLRSHIAWVIHGSFPEMSYSAAAKFAKGTFAYDAYDNPMVKALIPVRFTLVLPVTASGSYADLPVVVYTHGVGGTRATIFSVADAFCARGFAVAGIDLPFHGERNASSKDVIDNVTGAAIPDWIGDPVGNQAIIDFFDLDGDAAHGIQPLDPTVMRDTLRQSIADLMQVVRLLRDGDLSALQAADPSLATLSFDRAHVVVAGNSFGGFMSGTLAAVEPAAGMAELVVPAAGIALPVLADSPAFSPALMPLLDNAYDLGAQVDLDAANNLLDADSSPRHPRWDPLWNLFQTLLEPGDALAFAPYVLARTPAPAGVIELESYGDEVVPNQSTEPYAAAIGLPYATSSLTPPPPGPSFAALATVATPLTGNLLGGQATGALLQFAPASHGLVTNRHDVERLVPPFPPFVLRATPDGGPTALAILNPTDQAQAMMAAFAASWVAGGSAAPTLPDPF